MLALAAGRKAKFTIGAFWLVLVFVIGAAQLPTKFADNEKNDSASFLPGDVESTKALEAAKDLQDGEQAPMVAVFRREGGLEPADTATIEERIGKFNAERAKLAGEGDDAFKRTTDFTETAKTDDAVIFGSNISADTGESSTILDPVDRARAIISDPGGGLEAKITGGAGFSADAIKVFESINGTLLLAAAGLVFVLLILIYRSPIFFLIPLGAVLFAEITTRGAGWLLTEAGVTVNGQSSSILSVLVLGAGTDYALLLVARYREELHRHEDKHEALALALRQAGPAIVASALTVSAGLLCLSVAKVNGTAGLGPVGAMGVLVALVTMLTLLPALLAICGRKAFWPFVPYGPSGPSDPGRLASLPVLRSLDSFGRRWEVEHRADEEHGVWRRTGDRVARHPKRAGLLFGGALLIMCFGVLNFSTGLTQADSYRDDVEAVEGQKLLEASFPAGASAPLDVIVADRSKADAVAARLEELPEIDSVRPNEAVKEGADQVLLSAVLKIPAYSTAAYDAIPGIRRAVKQVGGDSTLVGGTSAIEKDLRDASDRDLKLIVPMVLAVVFLILIGLLRALAAPILLVLTVILSFVASLGVGAIVFDVVFGFPGSDPSLLLFGFVFLVALGIDYNIFLMARVREETLKHGTREGMLRGLAVTGGVITSAGIVLAGTFTVLAVLPLAFLTQIGFLIAFGVLMDTFVVRSILVPAIVLSLGGRVWWPSKLPD